MKMSGEMVNGRVSPGFEKVRDVFESHFEQGLEIGAACAVFVHGECVVDLWGGYQDFRQKTAWQEETLALVFSSTKGVAAMCLAMSHSRGWFEYDDPVVAYWPEFGRHDKGKITIRQLLAHQAGLCAMDIKLSVQDLADLTYVDAVIAAQKPLWTPTEFQGYHTYSMGWYMNGLMRHIDPQKRSISQFLRDEVATPLGLDMRLSLANSTPKEIADVESRLAHFYAPYPLLEGVKNWPNVNQAFAKALFTRGSLTRRSFASPPVLGYEDWNKRPLRSIELPSSNVICTVRDLAKLYSIFISNSKKLGVTPETLSQVMAPAIPPRKSRTDLVMQAETSFSLGFNKPTQRHPFGTSSSAFGTPGAGGSFGYADPETGVAFAYAMNKPGYYLVNDPREDALSKAVFECIGDQGFGIGDR